MYLPMFVSIILLVIMTSLARSDPRAAAKSEASYNGTVPLHIMVVVPTTEQEQHGHCTDLVPKWERGEEILPGAHIAVNEINDSPNLLRDWPLKIVPIKVPLCTASAVIDYFVGNLTSQSNKTVAIFGYFCNTLASYFLQLIGHNRFGVIQISAVSPILPQPSHDSNDVPHFHHILPSPSVTAKAAAVLIQKLGWSQIGVIGKGGYHDSHFSRIREEFFYTTRKHNLTVVFQMEGNLSLIHI